MPDDQTLKRALKSQYHAALAMLGQAIDACPDALWYDATPTNAFWQVAYHSLFFTHFYLQPTAGAFRPWPKHHANVQHEDGIPGPADPRSSLPLIAPPYARTEVLEYWAFCDALVDPAVDALDLESPTSGFSWYPISKLEHQLVNLRHTQHHAAQLADRLRAHGNVAVRWVSDSGTAVRHSTS
ncbi:MAG TPA: DinB family protein [Vicinamibacterales bacterium]|nr:DinB family protein [Vicinamibacterales bacterium]